MTVSINQIQKLTSPNPFALVSTLREDGSTNLMALSWWTYVSNHPATVAIALSERGYSHTRIDETGEFALNIVAETLKENAFRCGTCSGRTCEKAKEFGIELLPAQTIAAQTVRDARAVLECRVVNRVTAADHVIYIAEVTATRMNAELEALYAINGYGALSCIDIRPEN